MSLGIKSEAVQLLPNPSVDRPIENANGIEMLSSGQSQCWHSVRMLHADYVVEGGRKRIKKRSNFKWSVYT